MPARIAGVVHRALNLPVMDKASQSTEAYVTVTFADSQYHKTNSVRHSLNPSWEEHFSFEERYVC